MEPHTRPQLCHDYFFTLYCCDSIRPISDSAAVPVGAPPCFVGLSVCSVPTHK